MNDIVTAFADAMRHAGIGTPPSLQADGRLHRFSGADDGKCSKNCWYILHPDGRAAGAYGSWKLGVTHRWHADGPTLTRDERDRLERLLKAARQKAKEEREQGHERVSASINKWWNRAGPASADHPCLRRKAVLPHDLRQDGNLLLVPLQDFAGRIWNIQRLFPNGTKLFTKGARVVGLFSPIGELCDVQRVVICEGWATGATLHEQSGLPALCAMNAGNLLEVAKGARALWAEADLIVAADHDRFTMLPDGRANPGLIYGKAAAAAVGARLAVPAFPEGDRGTDFNDLHLLQIGARSSP